MKENNETDPLEDGISSLRLLPTLDSDLTVINAARVSFGKESQEWTDGDYKLLKYLLKNKHVSPFYHPTVHFIVKAPISVQRQWFKHKIGTAENSESTRYIEVKDEYYFPKEAFRSQATSNKQGSEGLLSYPVQGYAWVNYKNACEGSFDNYKRLLSMGVAKEQAREVLPLCTYTSWYWTASLQAVLHFIELRDEEHAQMEIRRYAKAMRTLITPIFPNVMKAIDELKEN